MNRSPLTYTYKERLDMASINPHDKDQVKALRQAYEDARDTEQESFMFNDTELLTAYAKYLLEYIDMINKENK